MENMITFEDLQLHEVIGEGGYGTVRRVTIKKESFRGCRVAAAKFAREICKGEVEIMCKLRHPNIVSILAHIQTPITIILLEYATFGSVHDYLQDETKPLPEEMMKKWLRQAALALAYMHDQNFLHRDIKASNCLLFDGRDGMILKLCDFGITREIEHSQSTSSVKGTQRYLAPEIIVANDKGRAIYSKPSDIYAYGLLMLEIYSRKPPFHELQPLTVVFRVGKGEQPKIPDDCPQLVSEVMRQCWKRNPGERPTIQNILEGKKIITNFK